MWLIYALGGGWGHLTRSVALATQSSARIVTNSPYAPIVAAFSPGLDLRILDPSDPADKVRAILLREVSERRPSCLIVDTFPRGLGGELPGVLESTDALKVLVHRDLSPRYVAAVGIRAFVEAHYDLVLVPGAGEGSQLRDLPMSFETVPWLVRSSDDLPPPRRAAEILRLEFPRERCVLICASGRSEELSWFGAVASQLTALDPSVTVKCIAPDRPAGCPESCWVRYWPAVDLISCASVVVGGGGYNTIHECLACRVPLIARPWPRKYDRQHLRAARAASQGTVLLVDDPDQAARAALSQLRKCPSPAPVFRNGAAEAARRIDVALRCLGHRPA